MVTNTGWIKLHRDIRKHWVFQRPDYFQYWVDLLMMANHQSKTWLYNDKLIPIRRGEVATSFVFFAYYYVIYKDEDFTR